MLQDYTVYTHLLEPLETLLLPGRRISVVLPLPAVILFGKQSRCGALSIWSLREAFWNLCDVATPDARGPAGKRSCEDVSLVSLARGVYSSSTCALCKCSAASRPSFGPDMHGRQRAPRSAAMVHNRYSVIATICFCHFHWGG
jgi:hypothetical protein